MTRRRVKTRHQQPGVIYLLHFDQPYKHAKHYTGWTEDLLHRLDRHAAGNGARLVEVIWQAGIGFTLVRLCEGTRATERAIAAPQPDEDIVALDEALTRFAAIEPQKAELVTLRYFAGLTIEEAAEALGISPATAKRHWAYSKAWLLQALGGSAEKLENP